MAAFQNRSPKAGFGSGNTSTNNNPPVDRTPSSRTSQQPTYQKAVWIEVGNITPSKKHMENSTDYQDLVAYFANNKVTFSWDAYFGKGQDSFKLLHKDRLLFNFFTYEDDLDFIVGKVSIFLEDEDKWCRLGNITATKKGMASGDDYKDLVNFLRTSKFTFNAKIWLKNQDDVLPLKSKEKIILNFENRAEKDKDFVIGNIVVKGE